MAFRLPKFDRSITLVKENFTPTTAFHQWWDTVVKALQKAIVDLEQAVKDIQTALEAADIALTAADTAKAAADSAQAAADAAQSAADSAQDSANGATNLTSVVNSGTDTNPLSAEDAGTDATIVIADHNRMYPSGTSVAVTGSSLTGLAYSTQYWVYYDDPNRTGGAVTYNSTTTEATAAQAGDRHLVGKITTPAALDPPSTGHYKKYPGLDGLAEV